MEIAFASVESAFDFSSSGPSLPGEAGRLLRVVIPLLRENPSALDPMRLGLAAMSGGWGRSFRSLSRVQRAFKLRDRSSAENGVSSRDYRDPRTLGYVPSCVPFARAARLAVPLLQ